MKKTVSLLIAFLMIFSCVAVPVYAEDESITISAKDVVNKVHNDGYYDAGGAEKFETQGDWFITRAGDWLSYDASALSAGLYSFSIRVGVPYQKTNVTIEIDDNPVITKHPLNQTGGYTTMKDRDLGKITIPAGAKRIRVKNSSAYNFYFESFTLTQVAPPEIKSFTTNAGASSDVVPWGADVFTLTMGAALDTTSVSETTVMIKDENENALSADVSATGNTVTLELNESLKPGSKYEIYANGLAGTEGQILTTPSVKKFSTTDSASTEGTAYIEVSSYSKENNTIKAEGVVKSSLLKGINGRCVYLNIKAPNSDEITVAKATTETKDGKNGYFSIQYTIPDDYDKAGKHQVKISTDFASDSFSEAFTYYTQEIEDEITQAFSGLLTTADAENALSTYIVYLDMTEEELEKLVPSPEALYNLMLNKTFENAGDAIASVKNDIYTAAIMQAEDKGDILSILNDEAKVTSIADFKTAFWNALSDEGKDNVSELAIAFESDIVKNLNSAVVAELMLQEGLKKAEVNFASAEVQSGEVAEIKATLKDEISYVYGFGFEFLYDEESAIVFDNAEIFVADGFEAETTNKNGVYNVKVTTVQNIPEVLNTVALEGDILTLKVKSSAKMMGKHDITASGYVLYHPDAVEDKSAHIEVAAEVLTQPALTVKEVEKLVVDIQKPINFFDNPSAGGSHIGEVELADKCIVSRAGEWTEYDISALTEGRYEVSFFYGSASDVKFDTLIDGVAPFVSNSLKSTGGYTTYKDAVLGQAVLDGNQKTFRLSNGASTAAYVGSVTFTKIHKLGVKNIYANSVLVNKAKEIYRGTDSIKVEFNNELYKDSVSENNVILVGADGKNIDCRINADGKNVLIDLKETLSYGKEYTLKITGIKDRYSQTMQESYTKNLKVYPEDNDGGFAGVSIEACKVAEDVLTLKGAVLSSSKIGIAGRTVKVFAKGEKEAEYTLLAEGVSGKDGAFELRYTFDDSKESGKYSLNIYIEYGDTPFEDEVYYFDSVLSAQIAGEFSNLPDGAAVESKLASSYGVELGIDYTKVKEELDDISFVTNKMANKVYKTATEIKEEFAAYVVLEKVNQADDDAAVVEVIGNTAVFADAGEIQRDKWDALKDSEKAAVAENLRKDGRIEKVDDLLSMIDTEINKILQERYKIKESHILVSAESINVGQGAILSIKSEERQNNVAGIHIEIAYSEAEKVLLGRTPTLELSKYLKDLDVKVTHSEDRTVYDLSVSQSGKLGDKISTVSFTSDIMTISYITAAGDEGTYKPQISGYISYHMDKAEDKQSSAYFADVPFVVSESLEFTVSKSSGSGDYEGGGGSPGGNLGLGGGNSGGGSGSAGGITGGGSIADIPPTTTEGVNKLPFDDIENVSWAKDAICALAERGVISGKAQKTFAPNDNVTRAEFCKMIALAFNLVDNKATCDFGDVENSAWYYTYIASAKAAGIINGREDNTFSPDATITREEMAAIALRAINKDAKAVTEKFADDATISDYAKDAVYTLKELGIINGVGENMFSPKAVVTRAMAAKVIYMLINV